MTEPTTPGVAPLADLVRAARLPEPAERKRIREQAGVSLQRMADELGVSVTSIWHWEKGQDGPSLENAARYRELLDQLDKAAS